MSVVKNPHGDGYIVRLRVHGKRRSKVVRILKVAEKLERQWKDEQDAQRLGLPIEREPITLAELIDEYLAQHVAEDNTIRTLKARLKRAVDTFGDVRLDRLSVTELRAWRKTLPAGSAWHIVKALRQVLNYAVSVGLLDENPAKQIPNPEPKLEEVAAFGSWAEIELVAAELAARFRAVPIIGAGLGLRPEEWIALERRDIDRAAGLVHVRRVFTDGRLKPYGKQNGSLRAVPLPALVVAALDAQVARLDTPLLVPGDDGGHLDLARWRRIHWTPAVKAAGLEHRVPYALRHSYAAFSIAAGVPLFYLARIMGTSVEQIGKTYGHLLPDSRDQVRGLLDTFLARPDTEASTVDHVRIASTPSLTGRDGE